MENIELIKSFCARLGMEVEDSSDGVFTFEVDERVFTIHNLEEIGQIVLTGELGNLPPENNEMLYKALLEAQHMFVATGGATFSIDPDTNKFILCKSLVSLILDADSFFAEAESFINVLHTWANTINDYRGETAPANEELPPFGNNNFLTV